MTNENFYYQEKYKRMIWIEKSATIYEKSGDEKVEAFIFNLVLYDVLQHKVFLIKIPRAQ